MVARSGRRSSMTRKTPFRQPAATAPGRGMQRAGWRRLLRYMAERDHPERSYPPPDGDGVITMLDVSFVGSHFTP